MAFPTGAIPLTGGIGTTESSDTFPTHFDELQQGGMRAVATATERDAITVERRKFGMLVFSVADNTCYKLANISMGGASDNLADNANWVVFSSGTGGGVQSVTGLNTDNTDPANPVVQIAVDGITIDGAGTPLSPLAMPSLGITPGSYPFPSAVDVDEFGRVTDITSGNAPVESVTGLNTDNTDPQNPVVRIAVDGVTITGDGTPGNPLVAPTGGAGTVTSVALSMPSAFSVSGSPITGAGTLAVSGAGSTSQYVRGDGTLASFPSIPSPLALETDGVPNGDQALLNLVSGSNVTLGDDGLGNVTINATGGAAPVGPATRIPYYDPAGSPNGPLADDSGFTNSGLAGTTNITKDDGAGNVSTTNFSPTQNDENVTDGTNDYNIRKSAGSYRETATDGTNTNIRRFSSTDESVSVTDGTNGASREYSTIAVTDTFSDGTNQSQTILDGNEYQASYNSAGLVDSKMRLFDKNAVIESEQAGVTRGECRATFQGGRISGTDLITGLSSGFSSGAGAAVINLNDGTTNFQVQIKPTAQPTIGQTLEVTANPFLGVWEMDFATQSSGIDLETDGTPNGDQTKLNLVAGTHITLTDDGLGNVTIDASGGGGGGGITQLTGDVTAGPGSGSQVATLANSGVTAGTYTNPTVTFDAKGRATAASNGIVGVGEVTYADGFDGPVDLDGVNTYASIMSLAGSTYTLLRTIFVTSFEIDNGITLDTAGYAIYCNGVMVVNGTVGSVGNTAAASTPPSSSNYGTAGSCPTISTNSLADSIVIPNNRTGSTQLVTNNIGGNGAWGSTGAQAGFGWGSRGQNVLIDTFIYGGIGGAGGRGTNGSGFTTASTVTFAAGFKFLPFSHWIGGISNHVGYRSFETLAAPGIRVHVGCPGGGGGAGTNISGGWGGVGGTGGSSPFGVIIFAKTLTISSTGVIRSNGGNGGAGTAGSLSNWTAGSGGGGAGGGIVFIKCSTLNYTPNNQIQARGGLGGASGGFGGGTGAAISAEAGSNGTDGYVHIQNLTSGICAVYTGQH